MAQISFSFSGGFWPISFPLFHGTARPSALRAVLVAAYMNGSLGVGEEPYVDPGSRALVDPSQSLGLRGLRTLIALPMDYSSCAVAAALALPVCHRWLADGVRGPCALH